MNSQTKHFCNNRSNNYSNIRITTPLKMLQTLGYSLQGNSATQTVNNKRAKVYKCQVCLRLSHRSSTNRICRMHRSKRAGSLKDFVNLNNRQRRWWCSNENRLLSLRRRWLLELGQGCHRGQRGMSWLGHLNLRKIFWRRIMRNKNHNAWIEPL